MVLAMTSFSIASSPMQSSAVTERLLSGKRSPFFRGHLPACRNTRGESTAGLSTAVLIPQRHTSRQQSVGCQALFGGGAKTAPKQAYICKDCGYIYDGREAFESLDKSTYACPVCNAPKRRFGPYNAPVSKGVNSTATRKARKAELQSSGGGGGLNPGIVVGVGLVVVVAVFAYLNATY